MSNESLLRLSLKREEKRLVSRIKLKRIMPADNSLITPAKEEKKSEGM
jgi:hypothetical protein